MPISKETKQRIKEDSAERFPTHADGSHASLSTTWAEQRGYIAGGEAEAERAQPAIDALNKIAAFKNQSEIFDPGQAIYEMAEIATEALANYNSKPVK